MTMKTLLIIIMVFSAALYTPFVAFAGVTVVQPLEFGAYVVKRNDAQYDITVTSGGSYSYSSVGYIMISPPQEGIFDIDGLPISTAVASVDLTQSIPLSGSGDNFQMVNFTKVHNPTTDSSGVLRIAIGATARSSGSGIIYSDQTFNGQIDIQVNF